MAEIANVSAAISPLALDEASLYERNSACSELILISTLRIVIEVEQVVEKPLPRSEEVEAGVTAELDALAVVEPVEALPRRDSPKVNERDLRKNERALGPELTSYRYWHPIAKIFRKDRLP